MLDLLSDLHPETNFTPPSNNLVGVDSGIVEQGSDEWHKSRIGKVTGSVLKKLMACTTSSKNKSWDMPDKIVDFGEGFKRVILHMAYTKHYNKYYLMQQNKNFKYGHIIEPYVKEIFSERYPNYSIIEHPMIDVIPDVLGISPDAEVVNNTTGKNAAFECKADMVIDSMYSRTEIDFNDKHPDFWQMQGEMIALNTDIVIYANAIPATDINAILDGENPRDYIVDVFFDKHEKSETHCNALLERARIAGLARDIYCSDFRKIRIDDCIQEALNTKILT